MEALILTSETNSQAGFNAGDKCSVSPHETMASGLSKEHRCALPEAQLILACARTEINAQARGRIEILLRRDLDWDYVFQKAKQNCVTPLLCKNLLNNFAESIPHEISIRLENYLHLHTLNNLRLTGELLELIKLLESHEVPVLAFKGPTLAVLAYHDLSLRQFGDLDVLVHKRDVKRALDLVGNRGYQRCPRPSTSLNRKQKDVSLVSEDGQTRLELHWRLSRVYFSFSLDQKRNSRQMWKRLETVNIAGSAVRSMPVSDLLLYLCLHGSKHRWDRLLWICDIAELIRTHPQLDWHGLLRKARGLGCERVLALGLLLSQNLLGTALPPHVTSRLNAEKNLQAIAASACELLFSDPGVNRGLFQKQRYRLLLKERWIDKARLGLTYCGVYLRIALKPNQNDSSMLPVPSYLSFLHYVARPVRLTIQYSLMAVRHLRNNK